MMCLMLSLLDTNARITRPLLAPKMTANFARAMKMSTRGQISRMWRHARWDIVISVTTSQCQTHIGIDKENYFTQLFISVIYLKKTLLFIWFQVEYEVLCVQVECEVEQNCRFWSFDKTSSSCFLLVRLSHDLYFVENLLLLITEWWTSLFNFCLIWPMMLKTASCK